MLSHTSTPVSSMKMNELIATRHSSRAFDPTKVITEAQVQLLLEAARRAPSSYNAQPWRYRYALRTDQPAFEKLLSVIYPPNQVWAQHAGLLILSMAQVESEGRSGKNHFAFYDTGSANMSLILQATDLGLNVRQMGGYDREAARKVLAIEEGIEPVAMIAIGYKGDGLLLPEALQAKEGTPTPRKAVSEFASPIKGA